MPTEEEIAAGLRDLLRMLAGITYHWTGAQLKLVCEYVEAIGRADFVVDLLDAYELDTFWPLGLGPNAIPGSAGFHFAGQIDHMLLTLTIQVPEGDHQGLWTIRITETGEREVLRDGVITAPDDRPTVGALVGAAMGR